MADNRRRYPRINVELPCRLYIPGDKELRFQAFTRTLDLGLGGLFVQSSFLLRPNVELFLELTLPEKPLQVRGRVSHAVSDGDGPVSGMGIDFLELDLKGREALLRYFATDEYRAFFEDFADEFPHLRARLPLRDVALVLNLWEEWKVERRGVGGDYGHPPAERSRA